MEDSFFRIIPVLIIVPFAYSLSRFFRFVPQRRPLPTQAALFLTVAFLFFGNFAQGAQVRTVITGAFTQGYDWSGTFFPRGTNLTGKLYTLIYEMDDKKGAPYYGVWPNCNNGLQSYGLSTPVPHAILTISGSSKSYTFGALTANSISSYVYSLNATSPRTVIYHRIAQSFSGASNLLGFESAQVEINLNSVTDCRSWESGFSYTMESTDTSNAVIAASLTNASTFAPVQNFGGDVNVATVTVSGPIEPPANVHIFFFDTAKQKTFDITNTTVPVALGQPIYLFAIPGGTPVEPKAWDVDGNPIGNYLAPSFSPLPLCVQLTDPGTGCDSEIAPADFANDSTRFYWTKADFYTVRYHSVSGSATATFSVLGPTNLKVSAVASQKASFANVGPDCQGQMVKSVVWGLDSTKFIPGKPFTPGISFLAQTDEKAPSQFQWEQIITAETIVVDGKSIPGRTGLDNYLVYPLTATPNPDATVPNNFAYDGPSISIGNATKITRDLSGRMYLLWQRNIPDSIPVTMGYIEWNTSFGLSAGLPFVAHANYLDFVNESDYPTWRNVVGNCPNQ
jgi:hypothetical protein